MAYIYNNGIYNIYVYMVFTIEVLFEVAIEGWPEWDLNPRPLNSVFIEFCVEDIKICYQASNLFYSIFIIAGIWWTTKTELLMGSKSY